MVKPNQTAAARTSAAAGIRRPPVPAGFEAFFRTSFRELVRTAMYAGATLQEAEDAASKTLAGMLTWPAMHQGALPYARKAVVSNFIQSKTRGPQRVARRLVDRGYVPHQEGVEDSQLNAWEDAEWVAQILSGLPPAQREVMELIVKGFRPFEIAEVLGKTRAAVRRNLCDARARLAHLLATGYGHAGPLNAMARSAEEEAR